MSEAVSAELLSWLASAAPLQALWMIFVAGYMALQRRSAHATLAWILALAFLPFIGIAVYLVLGPRRYDRRKKRRTSSLAAVERFLVRHLEEESDVLAAPSQLARILEGAVGRAACVRPGRLKMYFEGRALFDALEAAIAGATHHIHLEYYIWEPDPLGTRLRDGLIERAKAGVEVRVLVDAVGSSKARASFWRPLREAGGTVQVFNRSTLFQWRPRMMNFRTHRKIAVFDGEVGFIGGMNVTEVHSSEFSGEKAWRDTHVEIRGAAVRGLALVFFEDWRYSGGDEPPLTEYLHKPDTDREADSESMAIQIVSSGPDEGIDAIHKLNFAAISSARTRVQLTTPYFVPDDTILAALSAASLGGADVSLLLPESGDQPLVAAAARTYYPELLEVGVKIHELPEPVLHAKTLVVDDLAVVGTANTDNRSFRLNFEVVAVAHDARAADELAAQFAVDLERANPVVIEQLRTAGLHRRLFASVARLFSPLL